jgi:hypothetical protein
MAGSCSTQGQGLWAVHTEIKKNARRRIARVADATITIKRLHIEDLVVQLILIAL